MSTAGVLSSMLSALLGSVALAGLVARRRLRACLAFPAYLGSAVAGHALVVAAPDTFWNWEFWLTSDVVQTALRLGIAFEITFKTFRPLPAGYRRMRVLFAGLTLAMALMVISGTHLPRSAFDLTLVMARISYGISWLLAVFILAVAYHRVPIDPLHRDVAVGFGLLGLLVGFAEALSGLDPRLGLGRDVIAKSAYPCLLAAWCVSAWRRDEPTALSPRALRILQPWRAQ